jgi:hypothetical protein
MPISIFTFLVLRATFFLEGIPLTNFILPLGSSALSIHKSASMARSQDFLPLHSRSGNRSLAHYARLVTSRRNLLYKVIIAGFLITMLLYATTKPVAHSNSMFSDQVISPDEIKNTPISKLDWSKDSLSIDILNRRSIYTPQMFTPEQLKHNGLKPVTAVLLGWKRFESLKFVIQYLTRYPFIKEIIIWNNNLDTRLNIAVSIKPNPSIIYCNIFV